jgi:hypothetical protein
MNCADIVTTSRNYQCSDTFFILICLSRTVISYHHHLLCIAKYLSTRKLIYHCYYIDHHHQTYLYVLNSLPPAKCSILMFHKLCY